MAIDDESDPVLVPSLEVPLAPGRDRVWCAALDLAWQELGRLVGGPIALRDAGGDDPAGAIVRALNRSAVTGAAVDPAACAALAGLHTEAWVRRAEALLRERFGAAPEARLFDEAPRPELFVAYAYLAKAWRYPTPLMRGHGLFRFRGEAVESFGLWASPEADDRFAERAAEVLVHHHRFLDDEEVGPEPDDFDPSEEFVVEIVTEDPMDRLFIARCLRRPTLAEAVAWAMGRVRDDRAADPGARLTREERLEVPCVDFDLTRRYGELYGARIANAGFEAQAFGEVVERVRFRLDEGGARLAAEARLGGLSLPPRSLICDGPFLVVIARRGAPAPMLALWIETAERLIRPGD